MRIKSVILFCAVLLCFSLSSCRFIADIGGIISMLAETEPETEPFDRSAAYELIPNLELKYYLSSLKDTDLQNVCNIYAAVSLFAESCEITGSVGSNDAILLFRLVEYECPELFQLDDSQNLRIEYTKGSGIAKKIYFDYRLTKAEYGEALRLCEDKINGFLSEVRGSSDYETELKAFDLIAQNCVYDKEADFSDSAYGSLILGKAKCDGISRGFKWLCEAAGLQCLLITADLKEGDAGHAWNKVGLGGGYYNVDLTQNVPNGGEDKRDAAYYCFNTPDGVMEELYEIYDYGKDVRPMPVCDTYDKNYYSVNGIFVSAGEDPYGPLHDSLTSALETGGGFGIYFESSGDSAAFVNEFPGKVAEWIKGADNIAYVDATQHGDRIFTFTVIMKDAITAEAE